ncbi:MAG: rod-binding protein [Planctomycetota bacterium]
MTISPNTPTTPTTVAAQLRPVATQWVGQSFYGTMLKQARESSLSPEDSPFSGGRGGSAFSSMLDQRLAEKAGRDTGGALVDAIVGRLSDV